MEHSPVEYFEFLTDPDDNVTVRAFRPLIDGLSAHYSRRSGIDLEELASVASLALILAKQSFNRKYKHNAWKWVENKIRQDILDWIKKEKSSAFADVDVDVLLEPMQDAEPDPQQLAIRNELEHEITRVAQTALRRLTPTQRKVMKATYMKPDAGTWREMAVKLDMSYTKFKREMYEGRMRMKQWLNSQGVTTMIR